MNFVELAVSFLVTELVLFTIVFITFFSYSFFEVPLCTEMFIIFEQVFKGGIA